MMSGGMVMATASDQSDSASVSMSNGMVTVDIDGDTQSFAMNSVTAVQISLGSGDDNLMVNDNVPVPIMAGGGPGSDTIMAMNSMPDTVAGGGGNDSVMASTNAADSVRGGLGSDTVSGGGSGSMVLGDHGNDVINPGASGVTVNGGGGSDTVAASAGSSGDMLMGGAGDDVILTAGDSGNSINGGAGLNFAQNNPNDTMSNIFAVIDPTAPPQVQSAPSAVHPAVGIAPAASGEVTSVVVGTVLTITGTSGADSISVSLDGSDLVVGGTGSGSFPIAGLTGILIDGFGGNDTIAVDPSVTLLSTLLGGAGNDSVSAGGGSSVLIAGAGNDTLVGGAGTSLLVPGNLNIFSSEPGGNDLLEGGSGFAIADFSYRTDALHLSNDGQDDSGDASLEEHTTIMPSVLAIWGGTGADTIVGTVAGEFLSGGGGPDSIIGGGVDDLMVGGLGRDTIHVAAEPVTLYMRDGKVDQITGVNDQAIDVLQIDQGLDVLS
jgi:Ca2+-binding RTX toxin-like protein